MATRAADIATVLNVIAGPDPRDLTVVAREAVDYGAALERATLRGARLGIVRDYMGLHAGADAVIESAIQLMRAEGAEVVEATLPRFLPGVVLGSYEAIRDAEFPVQIAEYLSSLPDPSLPKSHADVLRLGEELLEKPQRPWVANRVRVEAHRREASTSINGQPYLSALNEARKMVRDVLTWMIAEYKLDALISPTSRPARLIAEESTIIPPGWRTFASMTGWPDLTVPVGFTTDPALPVGMSFLGPAFSEAKLLGLAAALERVLPAHRLPASTPPLPGERIDY
jgi:amidase